MVVSSCMAAMLKQHGLQLLGEPMALSSHGMTAAVRSADYSSAVFKLYTEAKAYASALAVWREAEQPAFARLLDYDQQQQWLLLERIVPGTPLSELNDDEATVIFSQVIQKIQSPPKRHQAWAPITRLIQALDSNATPIGTGVTVKQRDRAYQVANSLCQSANPGQCLHGDCHHGNLILSDGGQWLMIDPKGYWGEFAYDLGCYLRNPIEQLSQAQQLTRLTERRLNILAERLPVDQQRVGAWAYSQAILAAVWAEQDQKMDLCAFFCYCAEHYQRWT